MQPLSLLPVFEGFPIQPAAQVLYHCIFIFYAFT
jgi:hypothetical protein